MATLVVETTLETQQAAGAEMPTKRPPEREESVSDILREYDALRKSAEAERQAMRELMEKQRAQRRAPMPRYPSWQQPGQQAYPPAYNPYEYGYPQYGVCRRREVAIRRD